MADSTFNTDAPAGSYYGPNGLIFTDQAAKDAYYSGGPPPAGTDMAQYNSNIAARNAAIVAAHPSAYSADVGGAVPDLMAQNTLYQQGPGYAADIASHANDPMSPSGRALGGTGAINARTLQSAAFNTQAAPTAAAAFPSLGIPAQAAPQTTAPQTPTNSYAQLPSNNYFPSQPTTAIPGQASATGLAALGYNPHQGIQYSQVPSNAYFS
jgi:hypothetical protein